MLSTCPLYRSQLTWVHPTADSLEYSVHVHSTDVWEVPSAARSVGFRQVTGPFHHITAHPAEFGVFSQCVSHRVQSLMTLMSNSWKGPYKEILLQHYPHCIVVSTGQFQRCGFLSYGVDKLKMYNWIRPLLLSSQEPDHLPDCLWLCGQRFHFRNVKSEVAMVAAFQFARMSKK